MSDAASSESRRLLDGSLWSLLAEGLAAPSGLVIAIFLTRRLGPDGFGVYALGLAVALAIEYGLAAIFARTTVKLVSEAADWRATGAALARRHGGLAVATALVMVAAAPVVAGLLHEPRIVPILRLFAVDIPLSSLAMSYRNILIARGRYRERALESAARSLCRPLVVVALVGLGGGALGAVGGHIVASCAGWLVGFGFLRLSLAHRGGLATDQFRRLALPLAGVAISMLLFEKLDLYMLKALGAPTRVAGAYAAAQALTLAPGLLAVAYNTLLLSTLNRLLVDGDARRAHALGALTLRGFLILWPFAAMVAATAPDLVLLVFGRAYVDAALPLTLLIGAALALVICELNISYLTALGRPGLGLAVAGPMVLAALVAHALAIPRFGLAGAALVTTGLAAIGVSLTTLLVCRRGGVRLPWPTLLRTLGITALTYGVARLSPGHGAFVLVKLVAVSGAILLAWRWSGEFTRAELARARALLLSLRGGAR